MSVEKYIISEEISLLNAMEIIDNNGRGVAFVCEGLKLKGVITDGDIRRYILKKGNLDINISEIINYLPQFLEKNDHFKSKEYMQEHKIRAVPLLNENKEIISIDFVNGGTIYKNSNLNVPVIIMAGGKGTRLVPYTDILPKPLIPITDKTITELIMERFETFGCDRFNMIINYKKNLIKAYFLESSRRFSIEFTEEEEFLGTGGGLKLLKDKYQSTMFVTNCDILIETDYGEIVRYHKENKNIITMVCAIQEITIPYGAVIINGKGSIDCIKEKPIFHFMANSGMYIIEPEFIDEIPDNTFIHITDIIEKCIKKDMKVGTYPISEKAWHDMGQIKELENIRAFYLNR